MGQKSPIKITNKDQMFEKLPHANRNSDAATTETVTFPIPFPHECLNVTCTDYDSGDTGGIAGVTGIKTLPTRTTVLFSCYSGADTFFWQAIGY